MQNQFRKRSTLVSVVVPCFNESDGLLGFHQRLSRVLDTITESVEVVYVNDGSVDDTRDVIDALRATDTRVGLVDLSRNFGKETALSAGIDNTRGDAVIVIDADLQDPPEYIPEMLHAYYAGYDVVAMKRGDRSTDTLFKRWSAKCFYKILARLSDVEIPENVGDFRLLSRRAADAVKSMPERNRYMKGLFAFVGFRTLEIEYKRERRDAGNSKWPLFKLLGLALDGITSFSIAPLRIASMAGALVAAGAFLYGLIVLTKTLIFGEPVAGFPTLIIAITFLGGAQLMAIGLLGEYVGRLLIESKQRPLYFVDTIALPEHDELNREVRKKAAG
ncbi:MAG: glycosyltransferase family 2 protein [Gammaproteobacteria bacterium]|nr:glycosyltransferase family 2 protein [Gammaproteobacteria bacterium]